MTCASCGGAVPAGAAFCPTCGTRTSAAPSRTVSGRTITGLPTVGSLPHDAAAALEPGAVFAGRYEIRSRLGEGGMGVVYLAHDPVPGTDLVIKLIHPHLVIGEAAVKRLLAEGLTARSIRHPNIVAVYDVACWEDQPYFTMEYVAGQTLRAWLLENLRLERDVPLTVAAAIVRPILAGLAEAHRVDIVHRDLKPENVMLEGDPLKDRIDLKILDFGIARAVNVTRATGPGASGSGTPFYTAPEQLTSADAVRPSADLYSVSVMLYEILVHGLPQTGRWEPVSKLRPDLPAAVDAVVERGLSARPKSRFQSVAEYAAALEALVTGGDSSAVRARGSAVSRPAAPPPLDTSGRTDRDVPAEMRGRLERAAYTWRGPVKVGNAYFDYAADKSTTFWEHVVLGRRVPTLDGVDPEQFIQGAFATADRMLRPRFSMLKSMLGKNQIGCVPVLSVADLDPALVPALLTYGPFQGKLPNSFVVVFVMPVIYDERHDVAHVNPNNPATGSAMFPFVRSEVAGVFRTM